MPDRIVWDFSYTKPSVADMKARNVVGVVVYLARDGRGIRRPQLAEYRAAGLEVSFVFERGRGADLVLGYVEGLSCAREANQIADDIGIDLIPEDAVIFYADDINEPYAQEVWDNIGQFVEGAKSLNRRNVGVYAEADVLDHIVAHTSWLWETGASSYSNGRHSSFACLLQLANRVTPGLPNQVDDNLILKPDWGQVPRPQPAKDWFDMATKDDLKAAIREVLAEDDLPQFVAEVAWRKALVEVIADATGKTIEWDQGVPKVVS